ncbi:hypothetical protein FE249_18005 (plasmid) [Acidiphilium multivorum]|uniref:hypothetical protein n=1 Tax=Acidiphilium TaxID=522 RepID=UPI00157A2FAA|nr:MULTISPECIES: hypothetical protein [Acidiphilium]UNC16151.1 hypothetical protein FE249_18005 [Acidiphilium multivorum]
MSPDVIRLRELRVDLHNEALASNTRATSIMANAMGMIEAAPSGDNYLTFDSASTDALINRLKARHEVAEDLALAEPSQHPFWCEFTTKAGSFATITTPWTIQGGRETLFISRRFRHGVPDQAPYQMVWSLEGLRRRLHFDELVQVQYVRTSMHRPVSEVVREDVRRAGLAIASMTLAVQAQISRAAARRTRAEAELARLAELERFGSRGLVPTLIPVPTTIPLPVLRHADIVDCHPHAEPAEAPAMSF